MKKTALALLVFALCGISLPSCGDNDEPEDNSIGRYEVTYNCELTSDMCDLLNMEGDFCNENGEFCHFVVPQNMSDKFIFTKFPTEFGFSVEAMSKKPDVELTKDSYSFGITAYLKIGIYSKSGKLLREYQKYAYLSKTTPCSQTHVETELNRLVNSGPIFASFTQVDAEGKIVESDK
ncbi:MAG: hypothetical protein J6Y87_08140 [Muribaculaceae bacterium]|nr:hypothetical protein [Muribaculaceae bacterium]MBP5315814.1 hypothetical protein [Muribaculaceae bacterium]